MTWELYRWVWVLQSPLSVGMMPSGSLNRCRLYVPARTLWGAITAEISRRSDCDFPDYKRIGNEVLEDIRFTFLFPAKKLGQNWKAWLPRYLDNKGLCWLMEDSNTDLKTFIPDHVFRSKLLYTRPGTAIDPDSDSAEESSLHETEYVQMYWHSNDEENKKEHCQVGMIGYIFVRSGSQHANSVREIDNLLIGGDTRYGFGSLIRLDISEETNVFGNNIDLSKENPVVISSIILGQATTTKSMKGDLEAFAGWDNTSDSGLQNFATFWMPGSSIVSDKDNLNHWIIEPGGFWKDFCAEDQKIQ
ncbi:DUF324 domain containing Cmr6-like protein [Methanosarcina siciliae C2J]|uniref:DUF324 domain containing Cmr6-like protein n=1 Tax=Methanosarcina siciliae C2J TaxID=1434118 RepID=A0A0E3PNQ4_9EURY|nr:hypothetical protein [Methanosarcina siciliae]AKB36818.1 DUF324 domain containing Cmr6-like protein [Methanosarcina siciliae C2J]